MHKYRFSVYVLTGIAACLIMYGISCFIEPVKRSSTWLGLVIASFIIFSGEYRSRSVELRENTVFFNSFRLYCIENTVCFGIEYEDISAVYVKKLPIIGIWAIVIYPKTLNQRITVSVCYKNYREMYGELVKNVLRANPKANIASELKRYISEKDDLLYEETGGLTSKEIKALYQKSDIENKMCKRRIFICFVVVILLAVVIISKFFTSMVLLIFATAVIFILLVLSLVDRVNKESKDNLSIVLAVLFVFILIVDVTAKFRGNWDIHSPFISTTTAPDLSTKSDKPIHYEVGDILMIGHYADQDIQWVVIKSEEKRALVVSKYALNGAVV